MTLRASRASSAQTPRTNTRFRQDSRFPVHSDVSAPDNRRAPNSYGRGNPYRRYRTPQAYRSDNQHPRPRDHSAERHPDSRDRRDRNNRSNFRGRRRDHQAQHQSSYSVDPANASPDITVPPNITCCSVPEVTTEPTDTTCCVLPSAKLQTSPLTQPACIVVPQQIQCGLDTMCFNHICGCASLLTDVRPLPPNSKHVTSTTDGSTHSPSAIGTLPITLRNHLNQDIQLKINNVLVVDSWPDSRILFSIGQ